MQRGRITLIIFSLISIKWLVNVASVRAPSARLVRPRRRVRLVGCERLEDRLDGRLEEAEGYGCKKKVLKEIS